MAQSITKTKAPRLETGQDLHDADARGLKLEFGTLAFGSYATGGLAVTFNAATKSVVIIPPIGGYVFSWDNTNSKAMVYKQSSNVDGALAQVAAGVTLAALSNVPYIVFGW